MKLITTNTKLLKGDGLPCYGVQLAPHTLSGFNVCPRASDKQTPSNIEECLEFAVNGGRVAVPFVTRKKENLPLQWQGFRVVDGDVDDRIWRHPDGVIIGLRFKGDRTNINMGCKDYCLYSAGHGKFDAVKAARVARTKLLFEHRERFFTQFVREMHALERKHPAGFAVRMNVLSDIAWETAGFKHPTEHKHVFDMFPQVTYYDYTKQITRSDRWLAGTMPANYALVLSYNKVWAADLEKAA